MTKFHIKSTTKIFLFYLFIPFIIVLILYPLLPIILNYPPDSINNAFQISLDGLTYTQQYLMIVILFSFFSLVILLIRLSRINNIINKLNDTKDKKYIETSIRKVRGLCLNTPYLLYYLEILLPLILMPITFLFVQAYILTIIKICLIYILFFTLGAVLCFVFSQSQFKKILIALHEQFPEISGKIENETKIRKNKSLAVILIMQLMPLIIVALFFTSLVCYTKAAEKTGDIYYKSYKTAFNRYFTNDEYNDIYTIIDKLKNMDRMDSSHTFFLLNTNGEYITEDGSQLSPFFIKYSLEKSEAQGGRTYDYYCLDREGYVQKINYTGLGDIYVGVIYSTVQMTLFKFIVISDIVLLCIISLTLIYISYSLSRDIKNVTTRLEKISDKNNDELTKTLPVTTENEMGNLIIAFNKTQEMTRKNVNQLKQNQDILMERERLASLGQLIGGIAHNLKTPIMSISGATEGLSDLIEEYKSSISDPNVTVQDHHEIANEMQEWISKIRNYTSYMSDIITAVKGQAVTFSENNQDSFTTEEVIKQVSLLMKHELKNALVDLNVINNTNPELKVKGNLNSLVQVINNIISNAIQAYNGKEDSQIDLIVNTKGNNLIISVRDYGCGMTEETKNKLFNEMFTTKGKNGTGLGLFMSYSNIKAHFNGDITFSSELNKGTQFNVIIPIR